MTEFETYQPSTIQPNSVVTPKVFNGMCLIRRYKVTVEEVPEEREVLIARLRDLWERRTELRITHMSNMQAMRSEASKLGIQLI